MPRLTIDEFADEAYEIALARNQWPERGLRREVGAEAPVWEEVLELRTALQAYLYERGPWEHVVEELADVMIACGSVGRHLGIDLEAAVRAGLDKNRERVRSGDHQRQVGHG